MLVKKIIIELEEGGELTFEPKFPVNITVNRGIQTIPNMMFQPGRFPNGKEVINIISAPNDILNELQHSSEDIIKNMINS